MRALLRIAGVLAALAPVSAFGVSNVRAPNESVQILADQASAPGEWVMVERSKSGPVGPLDDELLVEAPPHGRIQFGISRPIPVLFTYSLEVKPPVPTSNFNVAVAFLDAIKDFGAAPPGVKHAPFAMQAGAAGCPVYAGVDLCRLSDRGRGLVDFKEEARQALSSAMALDREKVDEYKRIFNELSVALEQLEKDIAAIDAADLRASLQPGGATLANARKQESIQSRIERIDTAIALASRRSDVSTAIRFAIEFASEYQKTFTTQYLGPALNYDSANDRPVELLVAPNDKFADVFPRDAKAYQQARAGTFKMAVKPLERLSLSLGAGVLYSFVRDPQFSVAENAAGQLTVAKKEDDYAEFEGAIVLNITGADWKLFGVHPFVQVGLAPSSDNLAILAGAGLQMFDRGALSLGAIYQRVDRLAPGLSEGAVIDSPERLSTDREFKTGLYLMLSLNLK